MRNFDAPRYPLQRYQGNDKNSRKKLRGAKRRQVFSTVLFGAVLLGTCLFLSRAVLSNVSESSPSVPEIMQSSARTRMTATEAKIDTYGNRISVTGVGRVADDTAQGRLLGRRAAITDARRKLLIQRQRLIGDPRFQTNRGATGVSGFLTGTQTVKGERVRNGVYSVEMEMRIDELTHYRFDEGRFLDAPNDI